MSEDWRVASMARQPGPTMRLEQSEAQGVRVVAVAGELDMSNIAALRNATLALPNDALGIVVDLRGASFIDSATIGLLYELHSALARRRQALRVLCGAGSTPRRVLEMMSFDRDALSEKDPDAAIAAIREAVSPHEPP
jgi:anti-anti-sigma factor